MPPLPLSTAGQAGAAADPRLWHPVVPLNRSSVAIGGMLCAIAGSGKLACRWAAPWRRVNRLAVGLGTVPCGEGALIFAQIGPAGLLSNRLCSAILCVAIATTRVTPPLWAGVP